VADLVRRQHGVVTHDQLLRAGLSSDAIDRRVAARRLRRIHRGIYLVGPITPPNAREMAAVLACGSGAVLSHRSAAALWKLLPYPASSAPVDVTVVAGDRRRSGIRVRRVRELPRDEITRQHGIPITTPARTLLDVAATEDESDLEQAVATAERSHLTSRAKLNLLLARYPRRRGTRALRALVERTERPALTRSKAERRFLALIRKAGLPAPEVNFTTEDYELDFYWPEYRLAVEIDALWTHSSASSFESDRRRDAELATRGIQVIRVTDRRIANEPERLIAMVAQALAARAA
jgi:very-short-patch-repair endonuclease